MKEIKVRLQQNQPIVAMATDDGKVNVTLQGLVAFNLSPGQADDLARQLTRATIYIRGQAMVDP